MTDQRAHVYAGSDGVDLYRLQALIRALRLHLATGLIPSRGLTRRRMLDLAEGYTGKRYRNSAKGSEAALVDLAELHQERLEAFSDS